MLLREFVFVLSLLALWSVSSATIDDEGDRDMDLTPESSRLQPLPVCRPFVKHRNGSNYALTVNKYLNNQVLVPCYKSVSFELKELFKNNSLSQALRMELTNSLGDVCSQFVQILSLLARRNRSYDFCDAEALSTQVLSRDFCLVPPSEIMTLKGSLQDVRYTGFSNVLGELLDIVRGTNCASKCGRDPGKILCNAFYSLATVVSKIMTRSRGESGGGGQS